MSDCPVIIIGGGAAELSVALVLSRARRSVAELPSIAGLSERWGRDVIHCPYCHGYEVRDQKLGVLGGSANSPHQAQLVRQWTSDVVFFTHGTQLSADQHEQLVASAIGIVDGTVSRVLIEDDHVRGVVLDDGRVVARDAVFIAPRFRPQTGVLVDLGADVDDDDWVVADRTGRTSVPGVWSAGNAAPNSDKEHHDRQPTDRQPTLTSESASARRHDLAGRLPDPHRPQPAARPLAAHAGHDPAHLRARHRRRPDRHVRRDATLHRARAEIFAST